MTATTELVFTEDLTYIATPCPPYCNLPLMHPVDNIGGEDGDCRIHGGPDWGRFLHGYAEEYTHSPVDLRVRVELNTEGAGPDLTPAELRRLAADAESAARWLEATR